MRETITIELGGRRFEVAPLTFRQLRAIEQALGRALKPDALPTVDFDAALDILEAALGRFHPEMTREALLDLEGIKPEIVAATRAILRLSGYIEREVAPGEA